MEAGGEMNRVRMLPSLEKRTRWILLGYTCSLFGTGMAEPYLVIYLYQLRDIPLSLSGMIIGSSGLAGIIAIPLSGLLADRIGTKRVFLDTLFLNAAGRLLFACAVSPATAFFAAIISGAGAAGSWNALSVILASDAGQSRKSNVFGVAFALQNLGSGLGAALGGFLIHSKSSFQSVLALDAATFIIFALFGVKWIKSSPEKTSDLQLKTQVSRTTIRSTSDRTKILIGLSICYSIIAMIMTGLTTTIFPQWVTEQAHLPVPIVGDAFFANSLVIVIGQLFTLHAMRHMRRTRTIAAAALIFAAGCFVILISGFLQPFPASLGLVSSLAITAVGETLLFSSLPALANDLAPDQAKGRYNSLINAAWQIGSILGPVLSGWGFSLHLAVLLFLVNIIVLILLVPCLILLECFLPVRMNKDI